MTPDQPHDEVPKTGHRWIDLSAAGCALVVSITSLFVAVRHGRSMERMAVENGRLVQANSWPLLQRYHSDGPPQGPRVFSIVVVNNGVGPAKVESVEVSWKGHPVRNPRELEELCCHTGQASTPPPVETSSLMGTVLRAGESRNILTFPEDGEHERLTQGLQISLDDITWKACYCSVFDECWVTDLRTMHPPSVRECPVPRVPFGS
jgi:hypothetical protein